MQDGRAVKQALEHEDEPVVLRDHPLDVLRDVVVVDVLRDHPLDVLRDVVVVDVVCVVGLVVLRLAGHVVGEVGALVLRELGRRCLLLFDLALLARLVLQHSEVLVLGDDLVDAGAVHVHVELPGELVVIHVREELGSELDRRVEPVDLLPVPDVQERELVELGQVHHPDEMRDGEPLALLRVPANLEGDDAPLEGDEAVEVFGPEEPAIEGGEVFELHAPGLVPGQALLVHVAAPLEQADLLPDCGGLAVLDLLDLFDESRVQLNREDPVLDRLDRRREPGGLRLERDERCPEPLLQATVGLLDGLEQVGQRLLLGHNESGLVVDDRGPLVNGECADVATALERRAGRDGQARGGLLDLGQQLADLTLVLVDVVLDDLVGVRLECADLLEVVEVDPDRVLDALKGHVVGALCGHAAEPGDPRPTMLDPVPAPHLRGGRSLFLGERLVVRRLTGGLDHDCEILGFRHGCASGLVKWSLSFRKSAGGRLLGLPPPFLVAKTTKEPRMSPPRNICCPRPGALRHGNKPSSSASSLQ